jgi:hypothetical protein
MESTSRLLVESVGWEIIVSEETPFQQDRNSLRRGIGILLLLLLVCLVTRLGVTSRRGIIYQDSYYYIVTAKAVAEAPHETLSTIWVHPGYLVAMTGVHKCLAALHLAPDGLFRWETAGEIVSLAASLLATAGLWILLRKMFNPTVAWVSVLLFTCSKKWSLYSSAVLSESLAICFQIWAAVVILHIMRLLDESKRPVLPWAGLAGLLVGVGYLVRIEAGLLLPVGVLCWAWAGYRRNVPLARIGATCGIAIVAAAVSILPYVLTIGAISPKFLLEDILCAPGSGMMILAATGLTPWESVRGLLGAFTEAAHPILAGFIYLYVATLAARAVLPIRIPEYARQFPSRPAAVFIVLYLALYLPIVAYRGTIDGLSSRYMLFPVALCSGMAGATLVAGTALLSRAGRLRGKRLQTSVQWGFLALLLLGICGAMQFHTHERLLSESTAPKQAGLYLRSRVEPTEYILCKDARVAYYAQCKPLSMYRLTGQLQNGSEEYQIQTPEQDIRYIVAGPAGLRTPGQSQKKLTAVPPHRYRYTVTKEQEFTFTSPDGKTDQCNVYRLHPLSADPASHPSVR